MSASPLKPSREEIWQGIIIALGIGTAAFATGFASGWGRGRQDLLISLKRAQRIQRHLAKEE